MDKGFYPALPRLIAVLYFGRNLMGWLYENYNWIFSGVGLVILGWIYKYFKHKQELKRKSIEDISKRYVSILDGVISGNSGIVGLNQSGATSLKKNKDLLLVCNNIENSGKVSPIPVWIFKYINKKSLLEFIKWIKTKDVISTTLSTEERFVAFLKNHSGELKKLRIIRETNSDA